MRWCTARSPLPGLTASAWCCLLYAAACGVSEAGGGAAQATPTPPTPLPTTLTPTPTPVQQQSHYGALLEGPVWILGAQGEACDETCRSHTLLVDPSDTRVEMACTESAWPVSLEGFNTALSQNPARKFLTTSSGITSDARAVRLPSGTQGGSPTPADLPSTSHCNATVMGGAHDSPVVLQAPLQGDNPPLRLCSWLAQGMEWNHRGGGSGLNTRCGRIPGLTSQRVCPCVAGERRNAAPPLAPQPATPAPAAGGGGGVSVGPPQPEGISGVSLVAAGKSNWWYLEGSTHRFRASASRVIGVSTAAVDSFASLRGNPASDLRETWVSTGDDFLQRSSRDKLATPKGGVWSRQLGTSPYPAEGSGSGSSGEDGTTRVIRIVASNDVAVAVVRDVFEGGSSEVVCSEVEVWEASSEVLLEFYIHLRSSLNVKIGEHDTPLKQDLSYGGKPGDVPDMLKCIPGVSIHSLHSTRAAFAALLQNGTVVTWGNAALGGDMGSAAESLSDVTQIFSNREAFSALLSNGSLFSWGNPAFFSDGTEGMGISPQQATEQGNETTATPPPQQPPAGLLRGCSGVISVVPNANAFCAIRVSEGLPHQGVFSKPPWGKGDVSPGVSVTTYGTALAGGVEFPPWKAHTAGFLIAPIGVADPTAQTCPVGYQAIPSEEECLRQGAVFLSQMWGSVSSSSNNGNSTSAPPSPQAVAEVGLPAGCVWVAPAAAVALDLPDPGTGGVVWNDPSNATAAEGNFTAGAGQQESNDPDGAAGDGSGSCYGRRVDYTELPPGSALGWPLSDLTFAECADACCNDPICTTAMFHPNGTIHFVGDTSSPSAATTGTCFHRGSPGLVFPASPANATQEEGGAWGKPHYVASLFVKTPVESPERGAGMLCIPHLPEFYSTPGYALSVGVDGVFASEGDFLAVRRGNLGSGPAPSLSRRLVAFPARLVDDGYSSKTDPGVPAGPPPPVEVLDTLGQGDGEEVVAVVPTRDAFVVHASREEGGAPGGGVTHSLYVQQSNAFASSPTQFRGSYVVARGSGVGVRAFRSTVGGVLSAVLFSNTSGGGETAEVSTFRTGVRAFSEFYLKKSVACIWGAPYMAPKRFYQRDVPTALAKYGSVKDAKDYHYTWDHEDCSRLCLETETCTGVEFSKNSGYCAPWLRNGCTTVDSPMFSGENENTLLYIAKKSLLMGRNLSSDNVFGIGECLEETTGDATASPAAPKAKAMPCAAHVAGLHPSETVVLDAGFRPNWACRLECISRAACVFAMPEAPPTATAPHRCLIYTSIHSTPTSSNIPLGGYHNFFTQNPEKRCSDVDPTLQCYVKGPLYYGLTPSFVDFSVKHAGGFGADSTTTVGNGTGLGAAGGAVTAESMAYLPGFYAELPLPPGEEGGLPYSYSFAARGAVANLSCPVQACGGGSVFTPTRWVVSLVLAASQGGDCAEFAADIKRTDTAELRTVAPSQTALPWSSLPSNPVALLRRVFAADPRFWAHCVANRTVVPPSGVPAPEAVEAYVANARRGVFGDMCVASALRFRPEEIAELQAVDATGVVIEPLLVEGDSFEKSSSTQCSNVSSDPPYVIAVSSVEMCIAMCYATEPCGNVATVRSHNGTLFCVISDQPSPKDDCPSVQYEDNAELYAGRGITASDLIVLLERSTTTYSLVTPKDDASLTAYFGFDSPVSHINATQAAPDVHLGDSGDFTFLADANSFVFSKKSLPGAGGSATQYTARWANYVSGTGYSAPVGKATLPCGVNSTEDGGASVCVVSIPSSTPLVPVGDENANHTEFLDGVVGRYAMGLRSYGSADFSECGYSPCLFTGDVPNEQHFLDSDALEHLTTLRQRQRCLDPVQTSYTAEDFVCACLDTPGESVAVSAVCPGPVVMALWPLVLLFLPFIGGHIYASASSRYHQSSQRQTQEDLIKAYDLVSTDTEKLALRTMLAANDDRSMALLLTMVPHMFERERQIKAFLLVQRLLEPGPVKLPHTMVWCVQNFVLGPITLRRRKPPPVTPLAFLFRIPLPSLASWHSGEVHRQVHEEEDLFPMTTIVTRPHRGGSERERELQEVLLPMS